jgi:hypothetical protein
MGIILSGDFNADEVIKIDKTFGQMRNHSKIHSSKTKRLFPLQ